jgi:hypothetical protein
MRTATVDPQTTEEPLRAEGDDGPCDQDGDPSDPVPLSAQAIPCTVWFGPNRSEYSEREMAVFLGSHGGVAVLQWPRDADRVTRLRKLGIPVLWFVRDGSAFPTERHALEEWLPRGASDQRVHNSLVSLSQRVQARRTLMPVLEGDRVRVGEFEVRLSQGTCDLASVLIAHFDQEVDDSELSGTSVRASATSKSLFSDLFHLDQCVNQLGLEIVPVCGHAHRIRRCGP